MNQLLYMSPVLRGRQAVKRACRKLCDLEAEKRRRQFVVLQGRDLTIERIERLQQIGSDYQKLVSDYEYYSFDEGYRKQFGFRMNELSAERDRLLKG